MSLRRIAALIAKEWRETVRDRLFLSLAFLLPVLWMTVFGNGLVFDVEHIPYAVLDRDRTPLSRDYLSRFSASRYFDFRGTLASEREADALLRRATIRAAIIIPEDFAERLLAGRPAAVQTLLDGTFPLHADSAKGYTIAINQAFSEELQVDHLSRTRGLERAAARRLVRPVTLQVRYLYNQEARSTWSMVPAMIMFTLMLVSPLLTALGVVREKERGSIFNIYGSTVGRLEFLIGKLAPYVGISAANAVVLWVIAVVGFAVPFKGDPLFFVAASLLFSLVGTGIGLVVSLLVRTQMAALIITIVLAMLPTILFSGLLVPVASLSAGAKVQAHLFPAMYYTAIVRGSFLKGLGPGGLWRDLLALAAFALVLWLLAYGLFTKRPKT
ncbi:ABC transporter permease [Nitrospira sp. Kam-Ns4a]